MDSREAFERYMYGYLDTTPRDDVQKETRQHYKTWQAACKYKAEASTEIAETESQEALREIARLRAAFPLLREVMVLHRSQDSPEYNECEKSMCMWCEMAAKIMTTNGTNLTGG